MTLAERIIPVAEPGASVVAWHNFLEEPLTSPTQEELRDAFAQSVMPGYDVMSLEGLFGAFTKPEQQPDGYAFIDLDDVVADLSGSLRDLEHGSPLSPYMRKNNHDYGEDMSFGDDERGLKEHLFALIRGSEQGVRPVDRIERMQQMVSNWRTNNIYVGFITSQTAGSELPTITNFLGRYFAGNCDFLAIPDGHYSVTDKGAAAQKVLKLWGYTRETPVVCVDDIPFNTAKMRDAISNMPEHPNVLTIQPTFPSHMEADMGSIHAKNSHQAFVEATLFFARSLGRTAVANEYFAGMVNPSY